MPPSPRMAGMAPSPAMRPSVPHAPIDCSPQVLIATPPRFLRQNSNASDVSCFLSSAKRGFPFSTVEDYLVPFACGPKRGTHAILIRNGSEIGASHFIADMLRAQARRDVRKG